MKGYLYILRDAKGKFYIGSTNDLRRRLKQHADGHTQTTRNMKNSDIVLVQECESLVKARNLERKIKKLKRKDYIEKMVKDGYIKISK